MISLPHNILFTWPAILIISYKIWPADPSLYIDQILRLPGRFGCNSLSHFVLRPVYLFIFLNSENVQNQFQIMKKPSTGSDDVLVEDSITYVVTQICSKILKINAQRASSIRFLPNCKKAINSKSIMFTSVTCSYSSFCQH